MSGRRSIKKLFYVCTEGLVWKAGFGFDVPASKLAAKVSSCSVGD